MLGSSNSSAEIDLGEDSEASSSEKTRSPEKMARHAEISDPCATMSATMVPGERLEKQMTKRAKGHLQNYLMGSPQGDNGLLWSLPDTSSVGLKKPGSECDICLGVRTGPEITRVGELALSPHWHPTQGSTVELALL
ncbi:hypothetical protein STEG23_014369, partial [Scotinomys teguina]